MPSVLIPMSDYGHEPTETTVPWSVFKAAGFDIHFATESGKQPACDAMLLRGATGFVLGASAEVKNLYKSLEKDTAFRTPISWSDPAFSMEQYDVVFVPGGHEKGVRQLLESEILHRHFQTFFPQTKREGEGRKTLAAVCHGVQVLAFTPAPDSPSKTFPLTADSKIQKDAKFKSIIHTCKTTALTGFLESLAFQGTRVVLKDYYKSFGANTPNVEDYVRVGLDNPDEQFLTGPKWFRPSVIKPFIVEDDAYRYLSGRFMPDAGPLATRAVELVNEVLKK